MPSRPCAHVPGWAPRMVWIDVEPRDRAARSRGPRPRPCSASRTATSSRASCEGCGPRASPTASTPTPPAGRRSRARGGCPACPCGRRPAPSTTRTRRSTGAPSRASRAARSTSPSGGTPRGTTTARCDPYAFTRLPVAPASLSNGTGDFNGDWNNDVLARWTATAALKLYAGTGTGSLSPRRPGRHRLGRHVHASRPRATSAVTARRTCSPGRRRRATSGCTRATGRGGWRLPRVRVGTGWQVMNAIVGIGDLTGDGRMDVVARRATTGELYLYPGTGSGGWKARIEHRHRLEPLQRPRRSG